MGGLFTIPGSPGAAAFGILGQVTEFRRPGGRIRLAAEWVIAGVAASVLLTLPGSWMADREGGQVSDMRHENLLRTIWEEGQRADATQLAVAITYTPEWETSEVPPLILNENWTLAVDALPAGKAYAVRAPNTLRSKPPPSEDHLELSDGARSQESSTRKYFEVRGGDEDAHHLIVVKFPPVKVPPDTFAFFKPTPSEHQTPPGLADRIGRHAAWLLVAAVAGAAALSWRTAKAI
jgi:hypothetical protein